MAPTSYHLVLKTKNGVPLGHLSGIANGGFLFLQIAMQINAPGALFVALQSSHPLIPLLELDSQIEVWRNDSLFFQTLYQGPRYEVTDQGQETMIMQCAGVKHLLTRASVMWRKGVSNRSSFIGLAADTIMHDLVQYNITADATVENGRLATNPTNLIFVEPDLAQGALVAQRQNTGKMLLTELQELAEIGNVDFDLVPTGTRSWVFRTYFPQYGTDRSESVVFRPNANNLQSLVYDYNQTDSKNIVVAGGEGEEDARLFTVRYGPDYTADNHRETFLSNSASESIALIQAAADAELQAKRPRKVLTFDVRQTNNTLFGVHYNLGDLVSAQYRDVTSVYQVIGTTLNVAPGQTEQISVELEQRA